MIPCFSQLIEDDSQLNFSKKVAINSPLSGRIYPLDQANDPLFAHRIHGEGYMIKPAGYQVLSPFQAIVEKCPATANSIELRARNGLKLFIQLGENAESMHGEGFKAKVRVGQVVPANAPLLEFDLLRMKQKLDVLDCYVTIINSKKLKGIKIHQHQVIAGEDTGMTLYI